MQLENLSLKISLKIAVADFGAVQLSIQKEMFYHAVSIKIRNFPSVILVKDPFQIAGIIKKLPISEKKFSKTGSNLIYAEIAVRNSETLLVN